MEYRIGRRRGQGINAILGRHGAGRIMQRPDEKKRLSIVRAAGRLFATRPFHKVTLDDVAAAAAVGKGTLYVYFSSKEDLYFALIYDGFAELVDRLCDELRSDTLMPRDALRLICGEVVRFGFANPHYFELIRTAGGVMKHPRWEAKRGELVKLIERAIRRGVSAGEFDDAHPEITAVFIPGLIRSIMLYANKSGLREEVVAEQISRWVERGVGCKDSSNPAVAGKRTHKSPGGRLKTVAGATKSTAPRAGRRPLASGRNGR